MKPQETEKTVRTVMLHGFICLHKESETYLMNKSGLVQEHTEHDDPNAHGWNVWLRRDYPDRPPTAVEPFDSDDEYDADFTSFDAAKTYADSLAAKFDCGTDFY